MDIFWETGRISQIPEHSETQWRVDYPSIWDCLYGMAYICHTRLNERSISTEPSTRFGWTEDTKGYLWVNLHELIRTNLYKQKSTNCILHPMSLISYRTKTNCNLESWLKTCRSLHLFSYFCIPESHEKWGITKKLLQCIPSVNWLVWKRFLKLWTATSGNWLYGILSIAFQDN